jgi:hypothetical protein
MQDRYAGDVGDFGKFGLLRHLCGETAQNEHPRLKPGVIWYRVADETHNGDGRHISYLKRSAKRVKDKSGKDDNDPRFRDCDAHLYDALKKMVFRDQNRTIEGLEGAQLLPGAVYWSKEIAALRSNWFDGALHKTANCDLVFVDPDNGVASPRACTEGSLKHVFLDEIRSLVERKPRPNVVIYHHMDKTKGTAEEKTERLLKQLQKLKPSLAERPFGVLFRRWGVRAFLILPNQDHREMLMERTNALIQKWGKDEWGKRKPEPHFTGPILV